jgi:DNA helicase-2/ATP-dependent DNA helicase PcrA
MTAKLSNPLLSTSPSTESDVLASLNEAQKTAVQTLEGPVLVLAGAGTGKTRVLTTRLAQIILGRHAWPSQILAVTFTNKAASEMKERVSKLIGPIAAGVWIGTFHSLAVRILRRHAELINRTPSFIILDTDDQLRLIKQFIKAENLDDKRWPPRLILAEISGWKDRGLTPEKVALQQNYSTTQSSAENPSLKIYQQYQNQLKILNAVDFGDLLLLCLELFHKHPEVLQIYQKQFRYLLVDEYQDTNVSQYLWLRLLAQESTNICCVGDDDQSIYGWRGAEITNILKFEKDFPGAQVIRLEQNYRSTTAILATASQLISNNQGRLGKTLWTLETGGEKVKIIGAWDGEEEARIVGEEIEALQRRGQPLSSISILVRAGFQTREFEDRFITLGLPYQVIGGLRFYERLEIRDVLAYLRVVAQPHDSLALERILNTPRRGIGNATLQTIHQLARIEEISLYEAISKLIHTDEIRGKARASIQSLLIDIERWRNLSYSESPSSLSKTILDESGYTAMWKNDRSADAPGRLENLKEFVRALEEFESLAGFLEHVSLVMENNANTQTDQISLMTLHSAKGLEFETVFLTGWEEGMFPHPRALEENNIKGLEEERRLAYVGLTRAKQRAIITFAASRRVHGVWQSSPPSRFLNELPSEHTEIINHGGPYRSLRSTYKTLKENSFSAKEIQEDQRLAKIPHKLGVRVFHQKFGYGKIVSIDHDKLEINFEHTGLKKVLASFIQPT